MARPRAAVGVVDSATGFAFAVAPLVDTRCLCSARACLPRYTVLMRVAAASISSASSASASVCTPPPDTARRFGRHLQSFHESALRIPLAAISPASGAAISPASGALPPFGALQEGADLAFKEPLRADTCCLCSARACLPRYTVLMRVAAASISSASSASVWVTPALGAACAAFRPCQIDTTVDWYAPMRDKARHGETPEDHEAKRAHLCSMRLHLGTGKHLDHSIQLNGINRCSHPAAEYVARVDSLAVDARIVVIAHTQRCAHTRMQALLSVRGCWVGREEGRARLVATIMYSCRRQQPYHTCRQAREKRPRTSASPG